MKNKGRSELRNIIITILYQYYLLGSTKVSSPIEEIIANQVEEDVTSEFVTDTVKQIVNNQTEIDNKANKYLKNWTIDRLSKVDKAILSLGIYELLYTDTPSIVCINEAIELSKKYSDFDVTKMINACLDAIYHNEKDE